CDLIESFSKVADDPTPYEAFIRKWNGSVKLYQDMLDRKSGNSSGGNNDGDTPTPTPTPTPTLTPTPTPSGDDDTPSGGGDEGPAGGEG
ncbi:MAG: hypothetical protein ACSW8D_05535, partial [Prevotella sp.]